MPIGIATCWELPELDVDGPALTAALASRGVQAIPAVWDDPAVDWDAFEAVVVRCTWDYPARRAEFVRWAEGLGRVLNPAPILAWNTDKRYLADLAEGGVPTVATVFVAPGETPALPDWSEYVIKPAVGAGSADTARWRHGAEDAAALAHLQQLLAAGRTAMLQPYLSAVDEVGESALLFLGGEFSHSVRKAPILRPGEGPNALAIGDKDPREQITSRVATRDELEVAEKVLSAVPGGPEQLLYARVDLLPGPDGSPLLLELELTEPSLFLGTDPGAAARFAEAIVAAL